MNIIYKLANKIRITFDQLRLILLRKNKSLKCGHGCSITTGVRLRATDGGTAKLGAFVSIDRYADIAVKYGELIVGAGSYIGQFSVICVRERITIGSNCLIAEHVTIRDQDHIFGPDLMTSQAGFVTAPVEIGDNVWIGAKVTVLKGIKIGKNSVIGCNSVVTRDVAPNTIVAGIPASIIREIKC